jgi:hypothetical protein
VQIAVAKISPDSARNCILCNKNNELPVFQNRGTVLDNSLKAPGLVRPTAATRKDGR